MHQKSFLFFLKLIFITSDNLTNIHFILIWHCIFKSEKVTIKIVINSIVIENCNYNKITILIFVKFAEIPPQFRR